MSAALPFRPWTTLALGVRRLFLVGTLLLVLAGLSLPATVEAGVATHVSTNGLVLLDDFRHGSSHFGLLE